MWKVGIVVTQAKVQAIVVKIINELSKKTGKFKGVNVSIYDDSCEHMTTKICGRK